MTQRTEFGFLPEPLRINEPRFRIEVLDDYPKTVEATKKHIHKDWIYPPPSDESPLRPAEYFTLPSTHSLAVPDTVATRFADFLILALGFVRGLHLLPGGWLHFHRACAKPEMILDFGVMNTVVPRILNLAADNWLSASDRGKKLIFGAVHWHLFSRRYEHPFEVFSAGYTVLDTLWRMHAERNAVSRDPSHPRRVLELAAYHSVPAPAWAQIDRPRPKESSPISRLRNGLLHEGLFADEPIGFAHPQAHPTIHLELFYFNSRLLLAMLGEVDPYVQSPIDMTAPWLIK